MPMQAEVYLLIRQLAGENNYQQSRNAQLALPQYDLALIRHSLLLEIY